MGGPPAQNAAPDAEDGEDWELDQVGAHAGVSPALESSADARGALPRNQILSAYRTALDQLSMISVVNDSGRILFVNDLFCMVSGFSRDELIGRDQQLFQSGVHPKAFFSDLWRTLRRGRTWRGDICHRAKGGKLYWVDAVITPLPDESRATERFLCLQFDITEREEAKHTTRTALIEMSNFFDVSMDILCIVGVEGLIIRVNRAFERALGYQCAELQGRHILDLVHEADLKEVSAALDGLGKGEHVKGIVARIAHAAGGHRHLEWRGSLLGDTLYCAARDITEQIVQDKVIERRRQIAGWVADVQGHYISGNSFNAAANVALSVVARIAGRASGFICKTWSRDAGGMLVRFAARTGCFGEAGASSEAARCPDAKLLDLAHQIALSGENLWIADPTADARLAEFFAAGKGLRSFVGLPIRIGAEPLGVIGLAIDPRTCDDDAIAELAPLVEALGEMLLAERESDRRREAEDRALELARQDALTGLANRRRLVEEVDALVARSEPFALFYIDLDRFKPINDVHGHQTGDFVLQAVAERLRNATRSGSIVARLGGDEFAVIVPNPGSRAILTALAERLRTAVVAPIVVNGLRLNVAASIGAALFPTDGTSAQDIINDADSAMLRAKARRGEFQFFDASIDEARKKRRDLEARLREALPRGEIVPYYQPIVALSDGAVAGYEVLARWRDGERGFIPPNEFIPVAEEAGLIDALFWRMLRESCLACRDLEGGPFVAVNVSPSQIRDQWFPERVLSTLHEARFPAKRLEIEVTESAMIGDIEKAKAALISLKNQGSFIALDDFGTGFSSLLLLRELPINKIKIDRSFVSGLTNGDADAKIVDAILGLSRALHIAVTAEGVETAHAASLLIAKGCAFGQGYFFGEAVPEPGRARFDRLDAATDRRHA